MQIEQIGAHKPQGLKLEQVKHNEPKPQPQDTENLSDQPDSVEQTPNDDNAKGVLRLLQEGHFKGVADVRLRINFHDELAAIEGAQLRTVSDQQADGLAESVGSRLQALVDSGRITQEQADQANNAFSDEIKDSIEAFLTGDIHSKEELSSELNSAFGDFLAFISGAVTQPAAEIPQTEEPPFEEPQTEEPLIEEPQVEQPPDTFAEDMTTAFNTALTGFIGALDTVKVLPELSPPKGNGSAYQKFLEIYNELYAQPPKSTLDAPPTLDAST